MNAEIEQTMDLLRNSFHVDPYRQARDIEELLKVVLCQPTSELLEDACQRLSVVEFLKLRELATDKPCAKGAIVQRK